MSIYSIPLTATPWQTVSAVVNGQNYRVEVRQMGAHLFTSLMVDGEQVTQSVQARSGQTIIPWAQTVADTALYWKDTQGNEPPQYEGLGSRWILCYEADE